MYACFSLSKVDVRKAELFIAALFIVELRSVPLLTIRLPNSEGRRICGAAEGRGAFDHVVRTGDGPALGRDSFNWNQGYVLTLALQIWESSFKWIIADTISRQKYAITGEGVS